MNMFNPPPEPFSDEWCIDRPNHPHCKDKVNFPIDSKEFSIVVTILIFGYVLRKIYKTVIF